MVQITSFTKEKMDQLADKILASASVVNGELILTNSAGQEFNLGSVVGPSGDPGPDGAIVQADIDAAIAALAPSTWATLPLQTNFSEFSPDQTPEYRIIQDRVWLQGVVEYTGPQVGNGVFVEITTPLPVSARPTYNNAIGGIYSQIEHADLRMYPDGILREYLAAGRYDSGVILLDGLSYPLA